MLIVDPPLHCTEKKPRETRVLPIHRNSNCSEWQSLFDRDTRANPFQHPEYVLTELDQNIANAGLQPIIVRSGTERDCDGMGVLVPKSVATKQVGGLGPSWSLRGYRLVGGEFLLAPESTTETQSELLAAAIRHCSDVGAEFLLIEDLDEQSSLSKLIQNGAARGFQLFAARDIQARWRIEFPDNEEEYWKKFTSRTRSKFRARLKKFGRSHLERITSVDQIPAFLKAANEVSTQSWQTRQFGLRIRNDESELRRLSVLAEQGFLRSYLWQVDEKPAAFALCHQRGGCFRYEEIAYCAEYSLLSPGVTLLQQIVEDLYRNDLPRFFDFGGGDAEYKQKFGNLEGRSQSLWLVPSTWRASSSLAYLKFCRSLRSSARSIVKSCGLATTARQWLRYGGAAAHTKVSVTAASASDDDADTPAKLGR
jgi:CelD/BcsL family acetyltransferase involved in cellulose biosynthesis